MREIMNTRLYWKELTSAGHLIEPEEAGPMYAKDSLNGYNGFGTEEEAIAHMQEMKEKHKFNYHGDYVLVKIYNP